MARWSYDFRLLAPGSPVPSQFVARNYQSVPSLVIESDGQYVSLTSRPPTGPTYNGWAWDTPGYTHAGDYEVYALAWGAECTLMGALSTTDPNSLYYYGVSCRVGPSDILIRQSNGGVNQWTASDSYVHPAGTFAGWYHIVQRRVANVIYAKAWADGTPEPAGWQMTFNVSGTAYTGGCGFSGYAGTDVPRRCAHIGFATDGDRAPRVGTFVDLPAVGDGTLISYAHTGSQSERGTVYINWLNPEYIEDNGTSTFARVSNIGATEYLLTTNFQMGIPAGVKVVGVKVHAHANNIYSNSADTYRIYLRELFMVHPSSTEFMNRVGDIDYASVGDAGRTLVGGTGGHDVGAGDSTATWGLAPYQLEDPGFFNDPGWGFAFQFRCDTASVSDMRLYLVRAQVWYEAPDTGQISSILIPLLSRWV